MTNPTPEELMRAAEKIALETGKLQLEHLNSDLKIEEKSSHRDIVTAADKACEQYVVSQIREQFPTHRILGEEGTGQEQGRAILDSADPVWIIDPVDGTTNYSHGHPFFCVSIGIALNKEIIAGVVHAPMLNMTFTAWKSGGAYLNDKQIHVSTVTDLKKALLATGFNPRWAEPNIKNFQHFLPLTQGIRRCGAGALDLCQTAAGINDGLWDKGLMPWDMAAGIIMLQEAGGTVTNLNGDPFDLFTDHILAGNPKIHKELLEYFKDIKI